MAAFEGSPKIIPILYERVLMEAPFFLKGSPPIHSITLKT